MKRPISLLLILCFLFSIAHISVFADEYRLAPNDQLDIHIIAHKELDTKQVVTPDGSISLPLMGRINVSNLTLKELDKVLVSGFSKYIEKPQVVVYLNPRPIYVIQHNLKTDTFDVKEAKSAAEAQAYMGVPTSPARRSIDEGGDVGRLTSDIKNGDIITVDTGNKPDFWPARRNLLC